MVIVEGVVRNKTGLHMRPAQLFVEKASEFTSGILVRNQAGIAADGKSILGLMTMGFEYGAKMIIAASGIDEKMAAEALLALVNSKFGEE